MTKWNQLLKTMWSTEDGRWVISVRLDTIIQPPKIYDVFYISDGKRQLIMYLDNLDDAMAVPDHVIVDED